MAGFERADAVPAQDVGGLAGPHGQRLAAADAGCRAGLPAGGISGRDGQGDVLEYVLGSPVGAGGDVQAGVEEPGEGDEVGKENRMACSTLSGLTMVVPQVGCP